MRAEAYWVPEGAIRLAILPRPRGGDYLGDEIDSLARQGVDVLVSLLTAVESLELRLTQEGAICRARSMRFVSFPIEDRSVPEDISVVRGLVQDMARALEQGLGVGIHCRAGIGRSAIIAGAVLGTFGVRPDEAMRRIATARSCPVPDTPEQLAWAVRFVEEWSRSDQRRR